MNARTIERAALLFLPLALAGLGLTYLLYASQANTIRSVAPSTENQALNIAR